MIERRSDGRAEPPGTRVEHLERRRSAGQGRLAAGTLACPRCDAPVAPAGVVRPADPLDCPYCAHAGAVRDFLTLGEPTRPAHVEVRVNVRS